MANAMVAAATINTGLTLHARFAEYTRKFQQKTPIGHVVYFAVFGLTYVARFSHLRGLNKKILKNHREFAFTNSDLWKLASATSTDRVALSEIVELMEYLGH